MATLGERENAGRCEGDSLLPGLDLLRRADDHLSDIVQPESTEDTAIETKTIADYWGRERLAERIFEELRALGKDLDRLTIDDLAASDQFHGGGKPSTVRLATLAAPAAGTNVLDVGGGFGGPARTLAVEFGCDVTTVDLTESYVRAAEALTARLRLGDRVRHKVANALDLPFDAGAFDMVWTQNSGMNIADKAALYAGFFRVLRPGGSLVFQEPMAGPVEPILYPLMWATDASTSFLRPPGEMRATIESAGFQARAWDDVSDESAAQASGADIPAHNIQRIVMGERIDEIRKTGERNRVEGRIVMIRAVFERL